MSQGRIIIVSGPSGVGKGTILRTVMQQHESLHDRPKDGHAATRAAA